MYHLPSPPSSPYHLLYKVLAASGVDMDVPNNDGHTPVFAAATHGHVDCLHELAILGAKLSRRDLAAGNTPVMVAASYGHTRCVRYIAERAGRRLLADRNDDGLSAACFAVLCGREKTLSEIANIDSSLLLDPEPSTGQSAAHHAAVEGKVGCLRVIAEACAAEAAAIAAQEKNASGLIAGLWDRRPSSHKQQQKYPLTACLDGLGESPLHGAARAGNLESFAYLISEAGLRPEIANGQQETCLWLAAANNRVSLNRFKSG